MSMREKPKWKRLRASLAACDQKVFTAGDLMVISKAKFKRMYLNSNQIGGMLRVLGDLTPPEVINLGDGEWQKTGEFSDGP